ncbi:MAG: hypothetical protein ACR2PT_18565 [Endozoicomonas sp.]
MRGLAALAMKGPKQAMFLAVLFASIPMMFWLSAAIVSLVILRRGVDHGLKVLMWAILPGIAWAAAGQINALLGLAATALLACILRQTVSWPKTLLALVPVGGLIAFAIYQLVPQQIALLSEAVMGLLKSFLKQGGESTVDIGESLKPMVEFGVTGMLAWFNLVSSVMALILARFWQALLYNPGGFGQEFRQVRLTPAVGMLLLGLTLMGTALSPVMTVLVPIASLPLFLAGLALFHGLVAVRKMGNFWLVGIYMLLIFVTQLAYPVIVLTACFDSLFDFRQRWSGKAQG